MSYELLYHAAVAERDLPGIPPAIRSRIRAAIESRLSVAPEKYGKPLRHTLKGYFKLRIGDYRVVFRVAGNEVRILGIGHRKAIYEIASGRRAAER